MAIIEPFGLSKEERQMFHDLLGEFTEAIWQAAEQPAGPVLRLLPPSGPEIIMKTPEHHQGENAGEQKARQPARPVFRLLPASRSEVITQTPEFRGNVMAYEQETLRAVTRALLLVAEDAVTALSQLMSDVPSRELYDFPAWLASAQAIIKQAETLVPTLRLVK